MPQAKQNARFPTSHLLFHDHDFTSPNTASPGIIGLPILPVELIEHCLSFVDDIHTLAAICETGTLGERVATPLLYRNVGVLGDHRRLYRLQHLCQRLFQNPRLAGNVRKVTQSVQEDSSIPRHDLTLESLFECIEHKNLPSAVCEFLYLNYLSESELVLLIMGSVQISRLLSSAEKVPVVGHWTATLCPKS